MSLILGHFLPCAVVFELLFHVMFLKFFCVYQFIIVLNHVFLHGRFVYGVDMCVNVEIAIISQTLLIFYRSWEF